MAQMCLGTAAVDATTAVASARLPVRCATAVQLGWMLFHAGDYDTTPPFLGFSPFIVACRPLGHAVMGACALQRGEHRVVHRGGAHAAAPHSPEILPGSSHTQPNRILQFGV